MDDPEVSGSVMARPPPSPLNISSSPFSICSGVPYSVSGCSTSAPSIPVRRVTGTP